MPAPNPCATVCPLRVAGYNGQHVSCSYPRATCCTWSLVLPRVARHVVFALFWTRVVHLIKIHGRVPPYKLFAPSALSVYLLLCLGQMPQKKSRSRLAFGRGHGGHCLAAIVLRPLFCGLAPLPGFWVEPRKAPLGAPVRWLGPKPAPLCLSPHCRVGLFLY